MTVELPASNGIVNENTRPETVSHSKDEWVRGDIHANTAENARSLSERSIVGTYCVYVIAQGKRGVTEHRGNRTECFAKRVLAVK